MTKQAFKPTRILWVDLEMTGLDPVQDEIVEVAAIMTDWNFTELATYESAIKHDPAKLKRLLDRNHEFWDENPVARTGLETQNAKGKPLETVENELLHFCDEWGNGDEKILLGGNSIHQDRRFITQWWPQLDAQLHYRMLDVSAWKVVFEGKFHKKFAKPEEHRALGDIRGSIDELKYYLKKVKV